MKNVLLIILIFVGFSSFAQPTYITYKGQPNFTNNEGTSTNFSQSRGSYFSGTVLFCDGNVEQDNRSLNSCGSVTGQIRSKTHTVISSSVGTVNYYKEKYVPAHNRATESYTDTNTGFCGFGSTALTRTYSGSCSKYTPANAEEILSTDFFVTTIELVGKGDFSYCGSETPTVNLLSTVFWNRINAPLNYGAMYFSSTSSAANNSISGNVIDISGLTAGTYTITAHLPVWRGTATATIDLVVDNGQPVDAGPNLFFNESTVYDLDNGASTSVGSWSVTGGSLNGSVWTAPATVNGWEDVFIATLSVGNNCPATDTRRIHVYNMPPTVESGNACWNAAIDYNRCIEAGDFTIVPYTDTVFETLMYFKKNGSGPWVEARATTSGLNAQGNVDVSFLGIGNHRVLYIIRNKNRTASFRQKEIGLNITAKPVMEWTSEFPTTCLSTGGINMGTYINSSPVGAWIRSTSTPAAMSGSFFYPAIAGVGTHRIASTRTLNGCATTIVRDIVVQATPGIDSFDDIEGCSNGGRIELFSDNGYTWGGNGVEETNGQYYWNPSSSSNNAINVLTAYRFENQACEVSTTINAYRNQPPPVSLGTPNIIHYPFDTDGTFVDTIDLSACNPTPAGGGTWSAAESVYNSRIDNTNATIYTGSIDGGSRLHGYYDRVITYSYTDANGCTNSANGKIEIRGLDAEFFVVDDVVRCSEGSLTFSGSWRSDLGTFWTDQYEKYEVVWLDENDNAIGVGESYTTPTITQSKTYYYSLRDKQTGRLQNRVAVEAIVNLPVTPNIGDDVIICDENAGSYDLKNDESENETGGSWTSNDIVINNGIVSASDWNGLNPVIVKYSFTDSNGCTGSSTKKVFFGDQNMVFAGSDTDVSLVKDGSAIDSYDLNFLAKSPLGGEYSTSNVYVSGGISENGIVDVSNIPFGIHVVDFTYTVTSGSGCVLEDNVSITFHKLGNDNNFIIAGDGTRCGAGRVDINASTTTDYTINWYISNESATVLSSGSDFSTPSLTQDRTYYAALYDPINDFEGLRVPVNAIINDLPVANVPVNDVILCGNFGDTDLRQFVSSDLPGEFSGDNVSANGLFFSDEESIGGRDLFNINYKVTNSEGCENVKSFNVRISTASSTVDAGTDMSACLGDGVIALSGTPSPGTWYSSNEAADVAIDNSRLEINVSSLDVGDYYLRYTHQTSAGCILSDSIKLSINDLPVMPEVENVNLCGNGTANLVVTQIEGLTYEWFNNVDDITPFHRGNSYETQTLNSDRIFYVRSKNENDCFSDMQALRVNLKDAPAVNVGDDLFFCDKNIEVDLNQYASPAGGYWEGEGVVNDSVFVGRNLVTGRYTLSYYYQSEFGCTGSDQLVVDLGSKPDLLINNEEPESGEMVNFELKTNAEIVEISWQFGNGLTSKEIKPSHAYYNEGVYNIVADVVLLNGCEETYTYEGAVIVSGGVTSIITGNKETSIATVNVYPNPVKEYISIRGQYDGAIKAVLINSRGKEVAIQELNRLEDNQRLFDDNIGSLASGMYMLQIVSDQNIKTFKIIKK